MSSSGPQLTSFAAPKGRGVFGDGPADTTMNVIILDDYQDAVRKLKCASLLEPLNAKVFTNTVKGIGQLSVRLRDADVQSFTKARGHFAIESAAFRSRLACATLSIRGDTR